MTRELPAALGAKFAAGCVKVRPEDVARFFSRTRQDGDCAVWTHTNNRFCLGEFQFQFRHVAWLIAHGCPPPDKYTQTTCGNLKCCAPAHLVAPTELERFWLLVDKGGPVVRPELGPCWVWTASTTERGYGYFRTNARKTRIAPRYIWQALNGALPSKALFVCHHCDNPPCVRPEHLFVGTAKDNHDDMMRKGRHAHGPEHGAAVRAAQLRRSEGEPLS